MDVQESDPPPPPPPISHLLFTVVVVLRLLTVACLVGAASLIITNSSTVVYFDNSTSNIHYDYIYAYKYLLSTCFIGLIYPMWQVVSVWCNKDDICGSFLGNTVVVYFLGTGVGAGFGTTRDMKWYFRKTHTDEYFNRGYVASALVLLGSFFTACFSISYFYTLRKKIVQCCN